jgi:hypothetical protein
VGDGRLQRIEAIVERQQRMPSESGDDCLVLDAEDGLRARGLIALQLWQQGLGLLCQDCQNRIDLVFAQTNRVFLEFIELVQNVLIYLLIFNAGCAATGDQVFVCELL